MVNQQLIELDNYLMLAKTFSGLEGVLRSELEQIGATEVVPVYRGVKFKGNLETLYKANFCCRTALNVLVVLGEYQINSGQELYDVVRKIEWTNYFDLKKSFSVISTVHSDAFNNSMIVSLKTKDAIVDQFREKLGKRPSVNIENPDIKIHVNVSPESVLVSLDSSGESLHKRGYRVVQTESALNEVLAAGMIMLTEWNGQCDLYDPLCGSGTISIEAALIARKIPPGMFRKQFDFEKWKDFDADLFEEVFEADYEQEFKHKIYATDINPGNINISKANAKSAGLKNSIEFEQADFASLKPKNKSGLLIFDPSSGERMKERKVESIYSMMGDAMKQNFKGHKAWVFSSSEEGFKNIGLRFSKHHKLFNGSLECDFRCYEMYEGSRPDSKQDRPGSFRNNDRKPYPKRDFKGNSDRRREGDRFKRS